MEEEKKVLIKYAIFGIITILITFFVILVIEQPNCENVLGNFYYILFVFGIGITLFGLIKNKVWRISLTVVSVLILLLLLALYIFSTICFDY